MLAFPWPQNKIQSFFQSKEILHQPSSLVSYSCPSLPRSIDLNNGKNPQVMILMTNAFRPVFSEHTNTLLDFIIMVSPPLSFKTQETRILIFIQSPGEQWGQMWNELLFDPSVYYAIQSRLDCSSQQESDTRTVRNLILTYIEACQQK